MNPPTPISQIHWEIANSPPTPPTPWKNQKKKEKKIDDKVKIDTTPAPDVTSADTPNVYAQDDVSTDSNSTYSLRNFKSPPYSTTMMKNQKNKENEIDDKDSYDTPPATSAPRADTPNASDQNTGSTDSYLSYLLRNINQCCKIAPSTKNMTPNNDSHNADSPNADDYNDAYTKSIHLYLQNINCNPKIPPNTKIKHNKKNMTVGIMQFI